MNKDYPLAKNYEALHEHFTDPHELSIIQCENMIADHEPYVPTREN